MKNRNKYIALAITTGILFLTCTNPFFPGAPVQSSSGTGNYSTRVLKTYTVKFVTGDSVEKIEDLHLTEGAKIPKLPVLIKAGSYAFGGWYRDSGYFNEWNIATDRVNANITLYAKWVSTSDVDINTVTFLNGEVAPSPSPSLPPSQTLVLGALVVEPPPMTAAGYAFGGWYTNYNCTAECNFATFRGRGDSSSTQLYAKWYSISDVTTYTITFKTNSSLTAPSQQTIIKGGKVVEPLGKDMKQEGFSFRGWYTDDGALWNFATNTVSGNMTLHAEWSVIYYTVIFDMSPRGNDPTASGIRIYGGGDQRPPTQTIAYGGYIDEPNDMTINNMAVGNGYGFDGWYLYNTTSNNYIKWVFTGQMGKYNPLLTGDEAIMGVTTIILYPRWRKDEMFTGGGIAVWARDGSFTMGNNSVSGSKPAHDVTVTGFYISSYPVTQGQYKAVMGVNPSTNVNNDNSGSYPVESITWLDAINFCNELTALENIKGASPPLTPVYSSISTTSVTVNWNNTGYRLPTEAEWEYAARGGNGSPGNYEWAGSNTASEVAWFSGTGGNSGGKTHPVGQKNPNILRTYDMSGNVCEWCWDQFSSSYYTTAAINNPKGPGTSPTDTTNIATVNASTPRVRRGGSWNHGSGNTRVFIRDSYDPTATDVWTIGFRVVRRPSP